MWNDTQKIGMFHAREDGMRRSRRVRPRRGGCTVGWGVRGGRRSALAPFLCFACEGGVVAIRRPPRGGGLLDAGRTDEGGVRGVALCTHAPRGSDTGTWDAGGRAPEV